MKESRMQRILMCVALSASVAVAAACARGSKSPAEVQPGSSAEDSAKAKAGAASAECRDLPTAGQLKAWLRQAPGDGGEAGGLFSGTMEWAAVVNRKGEICAVAVSTDDPSAAWPGSQAIAKAKAYTANAFSTDTSANSTARLYTLGQPGHSLFGIAAGNPFNTDCLDTPDHADKSNGKVCGGTIAFGGGLALYRDKTRIGGLGISGDTACADHEIAKRIRHLAHLDPDAGEFVDDITYASADGPSPFSHPVCANTWRNGKKIGDEAKASGY